MYETVKSVLMENQSVWNGIPAFSAMLNTYSGKLQMLEQLTLEQETALSGVTAMKTKVRAELVEKVFTLTAGLRALALNTDDVSLAERVGFSRSVLNRLSDLDLINRIEEILASGAEHLSALADYGVTQTLLSEIESSRDEFVNLRGAPRMAILDRVTITAQIKVVIRELDELLYNGLDMLMVALKAENANFYAHYVEARAIIDSNRKRKAGNNPENNGGEEDAA